MTFIEECIQERCIILYYPLSMKVKMRQDFIISELLKANPEVKETPFGRFVIDYAGDDYDALCEA